MFCLKTSNNESSFLKKKKNYFRKVANAKYLMWQILVWVAITYCENSITEGLAIICQWSACIPGWTDTDLTVLFLHFEGSPKAHHSSKKQGGGGANGSVFIFNTLFTNTEMCMSAINSLVIKTSTNVADYTLNSKTIQEV